MNKEEFISKAIELGIEVNENKMDLLDKYYSFLKEYNNHTNITAITSFEEVYLKHFFDSLTIFKIIDLKRVNNLLDIGSGAGFPGIVIKIFFPNIKVVLVDSNGKKTTFLTELVKKLKLDEVIVINDRVENLYNKYINSFDLVTARAVTNMRVLTELSLPFISTNGYFVAMKGKNNEEIEESNSVLKVFNAKIDNLLEFRLYNNEYERCLIKISKFKNTDINTLRPYDKIIKKKIA